MALDKSSLYRFPWSLNDNPIGWVEVTDVCNLHCRGCYRQRIEGHKSLDAVKEEVLFLKKWRNVDNISIAGGEALLHPQIVDIVGFISQSGLKPYVLSNGVKLTPELLRELKRVGLVGVMFHVDSMQGRPGWEGKNEIDLCDIRQEYADLVAEAGLTSGFGITVYKENFPYIPDILKWALKNKGRVQGTTFITYRAARMGAAEYRVGEKQIELDSDTLGYASNDEAEDIGISSVDVYNLIKQHFPDYEPAAYLGGTQTHTSFKWLDGMLICHGDQVLGCIGSKAMELVQFLHHFVYGTYFVYLRSTTPGRKLFLLGLFDRQVGRALGRFLQNPLNIVTEAPYGLSIGIVQAPDVLPDGRVDMCDSCPDMTYFEGRLVNSCRLDEYRKFGQMVTLEPRD